jgi:CubicO group peptidase (beta-lactamase class C family)
MSRGYAELLHSAVAASGVTGASFAYWDGETLHQAVSGLRNSETADPVTNDTVMHIGSITKVLNAVLLMQLVDEGRLTLDAPVGTYLPELRLRDANALEQITCKMLLNHTSGIDCDILRDHGPDQERIVDAVTRCADLAQLHTPGKGPSYCNIATVIAGYLTQRLRQDSWYSLVKKRIYEPLGMHDAVADMSDLPRFRLGIGHITDPITGTRVQTANAFYAPSFAPCGTTLMMSAANLVTFARMLMNNGLGANGVRVLSVGAVAMMAEPTVKIVEPAGWQWGLGWMILPCGILHHSGGGPGIYSSVYCHQPTGRVLALLTNCDLWEALKPAIIDPILESWTEVRISDPTRTDEKYDPKPYEGTYENQLTRVEVFSDAGGLALRYRLKVALSDQESVSESPPIVLRPLGEHRFSAAAWLPGMPATTFRFLDCDRQGQMRTLAFMFRLLRRSS